jgi:hypothetical protein
MDRPQLPNILHRLPFLGLTVEIVDAVVGNRNQVKLTRYIKRHHISRAALSVVVLVTAVLFFTAGVVLRLLMGPVSLGPVSGPLGEAIRKALPGIDLQYDQAAIEWTRDQGRINLVVLGARMADSKGHIVASAPKADIDLAARPFLSGKFVVRRITLVGVQLALVHTNAGTFRLGNEKNPSEDDIIARLNDIINAQGGGASSLQSFAVRDARLAIYDEPTGLSLVAPHAVLSIRTNGQALDASFNADVQVSGRSAHVIADLALPPHNGPVSGNVAIKGLDLRALAASAPKFMNLKNLALITSLSSRFAFAPNGKLANADFDASASGEVPLTLLKSKVLHINAVRITGSYDGIARHVTLLGADLDARELKAQFKGDSTLVYGDEGKLAAVSGELSAARIAFDAPGVFQKPVTFQSLNLSGSYTLGVHRLDVTKAVLSAPALSLEASGAITFAEGQAPGMVLSGTVGQLPVRTLLNYWPVFAASGAREWIAENVFAGTIGPAQFQTNFTPGLMDAAVLPTESLKLEFSVHGVDANYLTGLTHLTAVEGTGLLTGDDFSADFTGGRVGNLVVKSGRAVIPSLHSHGAIGTFSLHAAGPMPDVMTLIDMKPLGYPSHFGIEPRQVKGDADLNLSVRVPMLPPSDVSVDAIGISVQATVNNFGIALGKLNLRDGAVNFDIDNNRLKQSGTAMLADQRFSFEWIQDFKTTDPTAARPVNMHIAAKGLLTPAVRTALGIDIGKVVSGSWPASSTITGFDGHLIQADTTLDLTPSVVAIPILNLGKAAGETASGHVITNFAANDQMSDAAIHITGPNLSANGTANFDKAGVLTKLDFTNARLGALNDLGFTVTKLGSVETYDLHGHSLDGSMLGRNSSNAPDDGALAKAGDDTPQEPFHVIAHLDRFAMRNGVAIAPFNLDLSGVGDRPGTLSLSGNLIQGSAKAAAITAGIEQVAAGRKLTVSAGDAGTLLRGMFSADAPLRGGKLTLVATLPGRVADPDVTGPAPDFQGVLDIDNFTLVKQTFISRLFSAGSLTGVSDLLSGDGISIENLDVPFASKNNVISVKEARMRGRALGATADGYIDRPKNVIALKGSLIPAYGLNSIISNVPVLGDLLASKKGEGIFGVTYSVTGSADDMTIEKNPLSMITPGILRRIWEGHLPTAPDAPSNAPSPAASAAN